MNIYDVSYKLNSKNNDQYIHISDLHGYFDPTIAEYIRSKEEIKYVIISGDLLNGYDWENKNKLKQFKVFLETIAENHKVIVSLGDYDLCNQKLEGYRNFKRLYDTNIYPICNETIEIDNNRFTSFVPNVDCYSYPEQNSQETIDKVLDMYYSKIKSPESNSKYTEHLISHNPYHFNNPELSKKIASRYDIIETGHFHDGLIPTEYLDENYDTILNKSIQELVKNKVFGTDPLSLKVNPRRDLARGVTYVYDDGYYVVLPDNNIYYYNNNLNKYIRMNNNILNKRLSMTPKPALVISGAINTFLRLKMFYPYITNIELTNKDEVHEGKSLIKKI